MTRLHGLSLALLVSSSIASAVACGGSTLDPNGAGSSPTDASGAVVANDAGARSKADASDGSSSTSADGGSVDASIAHRSHVRCSVDADCAGGHCVELAPGGVRACAFPPTPPQACVDSGVNQPFSDACCPGDGKCGSGRCALVTACGGAYVNPHNECVEDECATNADCGSGGICLPIGLGDPTRRTCLQGNECTKDAECTDMPGGECALPGFIAPDAACAPWTCGGDARPRAYPLICIYGSDCADDAECPNGHCERSGSRSRCVAGARATCPPPP